MNPSNRIVKSVILLERGFGSERVDTLKANLVNSVSKFFNFLKGRRKKGMKPRLRLKGNNHHPYSRAVGFLTE